MAFTFFPNDPRERVRKYRSYKPKGASWVAPEHQKLAQGMRRSKRVDQDGLFPDGPLGHLIVDKRPKIMIPQKPINPLVVTSNEICY